MTKSERRTGLILLFIALAGFVSFVLGVVFLKDPPDAVAIADLVSFAVSFVGSGYVARKRGRSRAWAFLGFLNWLGIVVAFCLKDRRQKRPLEEVRAGREGRAARDIELAERVALLADYGYDRYLLLDASQEKPYEDALAGVVAHGADAVPLLLAQLGRSEYVALALGSISTDEALRALNQELRSNEWRRVEAAAKGLGRSNHPSAATMLEVARNSRFANTIAEVSTAIAKALNQIESRRQGANWLTVDVNRPWQQIMLVQGKLAEFRRDEALRGQAIEWWRHFVEVMPEMKIAIPGRDYPANDVKARAWSCLAVTIYYLLNPGDSGFSKPCAEARYCWEQALRLMPGDAYYESSMKSVS